jgi:hypothetical protein
MRRRTVHNCGRINCNGIESFRDRESVQQETPRAPGSLDLLSLYPRLRQGPEKSTPLCDKENVSTYTDTVSTRCLVNTVVLMWPHRQATFNFMLQNDRWTEEQHWSRQRELYRDFCCETKGTFHAARAHCVCIVVNSFVFLPPDEKESNGELLRKFL